MVLLLCFILTCWIDCKTRNLYGIRVLNSLSMLACLFSCAVGSLIGLGIQFGVAAEAIQMAAILSFPKTPWVMSNPLIHEAKDYNGQS
jgi:ABC-type dipeptide/oligopeptide/nickel transport system permease subunit